jgi:hypothetical protein
MTASPPADAPTACAAGTYTHEADVSPPIANRVFPARDDLTTR